MRGNRETSKQTQSFGGGRKIATVSVIIPAFNAARTLEETLDSVVSQTFEPHEVIVIDDGSQDNTVEIAERFGGKLPGLKIISKANGGVSAARNAGIEASSGELIATLDADDIWHPTYLEKMTRRLADFPDAGFVYAFFRSIDMQSRVSNRQAPLAVDGWGFYTFLVRNYVGNGSNAVYRRDALFAAGLFEPSLAGSEDFYLQALIAWNHPVCCVREHLVGYRNTSGSLSKRWLAMCDADDRVLKLFRERLPLLRREVWGWIGAAVLRKRLLAYKQEGRTPPNEMLTRVRMILLDPELSIPAEIRRLRGIAGAPGPKRPDSEQSRHFLDADPAQWTPSKHPHRRRRLDRARRLDEEHGRRRATPAA